MINYTIITCEKMDADARLCGLFARSLEFRV